MNIGDILRTSAERATMPIGSVIQHDSPGGDVWTKEGFNEWRSRHLHRTDGGGGWIPDDDRNSVHYYRVVSVPDHLGVGHVVTSGAQFRALPVGTMIHRVGEEESTDYQWTKREDGAWVRHDGHRIGSPNASSFFSVRSLPGVNQTVAQVPTRIHTAAEREAAPIGARIVADCQDRTRAWTKTGPDEWVREFDSERRANRRPDGGGSWYVDMDAGDTRYYEVLEWPVADTVAVAGVVADYAALLGLAEGERFHSNTNPTTVWEVRPDSRAVRWGDPTSTTVGLSVFEGPANAGHLRTGVEQQVPTPHLAVGELITTVEQFDALPIGTTIRGGTGVVRTKEDTGLWRPRGRTSEPRHGERLRLGFHTVDSLPEQVEAAPPENSVALPAVGEGVMTLEQMIALPLGTRVRAGGGSWTKREDGWRHRDAGRGQGDDTMTLDGYNTVDYLPHETAAAGIWQVGYTANTAAQLDSMPVGTVIRWGTSRARRTKHADGLWATSPTGRGVAATGLSMDAGWTVESLHGQEVPVSMGTAITSATQFTALPVGAVIINPNGVRWTKWADGSFGETPGSRVPDTMNTASWWTVVEPFDEPMVFAIGMDIETVEQYAALPVHSVVREDGDNFFPITKRDAETWQDQSTTWSNDTVSGATRRLVALPQDPVLPAATGRPDIARDEHERVVQAARRAGEVTGREARSEEVLSTLREAWDGDSFTEHEINMVLSDLGLEEIAPDTTEEITVTVEVEGRSTVSITEVENLIEGDFDARLDTDPVINWTISGMDFGDIEVDEGDCGCNQVSEAMVRERLVDGGVSFDSFTYSGSCPNC